MKYEKDIAECGTEKPQWVQNVCLNIGACIGILEVGDNMGGISEKQSDFPVSYIVSTS